MGQVTIGRLRGDTVVETKATLKVVRARVKCVLIYSKIENATLCCYHGHRLVYSNILEDRECNPVCYHGHRLHT